MLTQGALALIRLYRFFSKFFPAQCRFYPTCSRYTYQAIETYGLVHGVSLGLRRIARCHPLNPGGVDMLQEPTPKQIT